MYMYGVTANDRQEGFFYGLESFRAWLMGVALNLHDRLAKGMLEKVPCCLRVCSAYDYQRLLLSA
jgi:hypothetical protein